MRQTILLLLLSCVFSVSAPAQETKRSVYAGEERREIKSLSAEEIKQLTQGEGMGLARAAELNHYPGPRHVLELAARLQLTPEQRAAAEAAFDTMRREAVRVGREIIERERELDALFAKGEIDSSKLRTLASEIGRLQGLLRAAHLAAHLEMRRVLSPAQIKKYDELRGYTAGGQKKTHETPPHDHGHGKH